MPLRVPSPQEFTELGAIEQGRETIRRRVIGAWDDFIRLAEQVDMHSPSRLPGWRAHEICLHLGAWDDYQPVRGVLAAAQAAQKGIRPDAEATLDDVAAEVTRAHRDATPADIVEALRRARSDADAYLTPPEPQDLDRVLVVSSVGALPALTILHAQIYELAVHGLDLQSAGGPPPPASLLDAGLAALTDAAGALAARVGIVSTSGIRSETGTWAFRSGLQGWQIERSPPGPAGLDAFGAKLPVRVDATAAVLLDASAARINPLVAVATRRLRLHGIPGLLGLAPIVELVPGIPGAPVLRAAGRGLAGAGGVLSRISRR
jgi:hypothetical protein